MTEVFLDIETIPGQQDWVRGYVEGKVKPPATIKKQESIDKWYEESYPEAVEEALSKCSFDGAMNHIICIGAAIGENDPVTFYATSIEEERACLVGFYAWLQEKTMRDDKFNAGAGNIYIGHNITGFDLKVIRQRSIVLGVIPPRGIPFDAKPWDKNPFDTMMQWDGKNMASLDKLALAFGLDGKGDIDGSMVYDLWKAAEHEKIAEYCKKDVRLVRDVYSRMSLVF